MKNILGAAAIILTGTSAVGQENKELKMLEIPLGCAAIMGDENTIVTCTKTEGLPDMDFVEIGEAISILRGDTADAMIAIIRQEFEIPSGVIINESIDLDGDGVNEKFISNSLQGNLVEGQVSYGKLDEVIDCVISHGLGTCNEGKTLAVPYSPVVSRLTDSITLDLYKEREIEGDPDEIINNTSTYTTQYDLSTAL
ncbi:hypothetical protein GW846_04340 [Candidatus Gracilibacteria bacterium]|nr:hypothetical protein [Candidatus Gracilibacteria bacterium]